MDELDDLLGDLDLSLDELYLTGEDYCPQTPTPKQLEFLGLDCFEALFGGAAGPGKSSALLMAALQYVHVPGYRALLLRRTYAELALPGALMDRAHEWFGGTDAHWNGQGKTWTFPAGSTITFGYMDSPKDKYRYQGSELDFLGIDELTQFPEESYRFLLSRIRRTQQSFIPLRVRSASNPGGVGHDWVYERFVAGGGSDDRVFVPARLDDNPHLDAVSYRQALERLDVTTRAQLLEGEWIRDSQGCIYDYRDSRNGVDFAPDPGDQWSYILGVDLGASQAKATTAFVVIAYSKWSQDPLVILESYAEAGLIPSTVAQHIRRLQERYEGFDSIVMDAGALGAGYVEEMRSRYALPVTPAQKRDKLGYRRLLNGDLQSGTLKLVRPTNEALIEELQKLIWDAKMRDADPSFDDHLSDAALYAWREAKHWVAEKRLDVPKQGSREYAEWEETEMERQELAEVEEEENREWWEM